MKPEDNLNSEYAILKKLKEDSNIIGLPENPTEDDILLTILSCKYFLRDVPPHKQLWDQLIKIKILEEKP